MGKDTFEKHYRGLFRLKSVKNFLFSSISVSSQIFSSLQNCAQFTEGQFQQPRDVRRRIQKQNFDPLLRAHFCPLLFPRFYIFNNNFLISIRRFKWLILETICDCGVNNFNAKFRHFDEIVSDQPSWQKLTIFLFYALSRLSRNQF